MKIIFIVIVLFLLLVVATTVVIAGINTIIQGWKEPYPFSTRLSVAIMTGLIVIVALVVISKMVSIMLV